MSKFAEVWKALNDENTKATKSKKSKNVPYSKKKEAMMTQSLLNTPDYSSKVMRTKNGEYIEEEIMPVAEFRKQFVGKVLRDAGVDKAQAEDAEKNYEFTMAQSTAFANMARENTEQFMRAGFTYEVAKKKDLVASTKIEKIDARDVVARVPLTGETTESHHGAHLELTRKSSTPAWLKKRIK